MGIVFLKFGGSRDGRLIMKIQRSISIDATAERIWPLLVEPENIMKWCSFAKKVRYTSERIRGLGTTFYFEERAAGRLMKLHFVVDEWMFGESVSFKMTSGNFIKGYQQRYTLKPLSKGIHLTIFENVKLPWGILGKLVGVFRKSRSNSHLDDMLKQLKHICEVKAAVVI
jgi:hypothetical protein